MKKCVILTLVALGVIFLFIYLYSCGGSNGGGSGTLTLDLGPLAQNIALTEGVEFSIIFTDTYDAHNIGDPFGSFGLNLMDNLPGVDFVPLGTITALSGGVKPLQAGTGQMWMYIDRAEAVSTVCTSGIAFGPFNVFFDSTQLVSVSPSSAQADQSAVDIINMGSLAMCIRIIPPVDSEVSLDKVEFDTEDCGTQPADMDGTWTGPYTCDSSCGPSFGGTVTLIITQNMDDPSQASYIDSEASYEGTVCGNRFNFSGGKSGSYSESGTFLMDGDIAVKDSTYRNLDGCRGDCHDELTKVVDL